MTFPLGEVGERKERERGGARARPRAPRTSRSGSESSSASRSRFTRTTGTTGVGASRALAGSTSRFTRTGLLRKLGPSCFATRTRASRGWNRENPAWTGWTSPLPAESPGAASRQDRARGKQPIRSGAVMEAKDLYESPTGTNHAAENFKEVLPFVVSLLLRAHRGPKLSLDPRCLQDTLCPETTIGRSSPVSAPQRSTPLHRTRRHSQVIPFLQQPGDSNSTFRGITEKCE
ncbi:uncharacterized protein LOC123328751 [Bubalus bubalis]|uniref:uncharacterized protein LOC123328751 n=1 Tax=Bubalus bubalis TaxID=89462 RepID=UPI001D109ECD|nr:uncharacterized protein LOC123328751 [Bubalus bubalis]